MEKLLKGGKLTGQLIEAVPGKVKESGQQQELALAELRTGVAIVHVPRAGRARQAKAQACSVVASDRIRRALVETGIEWSHAPSQAGFTM